MSGVYHNTQYKHSKAKSYLRSVFSSFSETAALFSLRIIYLNSSCSRALVLGLLYIQHSLRISSSCGVNGSRHSVSISSNGSWNQTFLSMSEEAGYCLSVSWLNYSQVIHSTDFSFCLCRSANVLNFEDNIGGWQINQEHDADQLILWSNCLVIYLYWKNERQNLKENHTWCCLIRRSVWVNLRSSHTSLTCLSLIESGK